MSNNTRKDGVVNISESRTEAEQGARKERFRNYRQSEVADHHRIGNIVCRIYANETHAGEVLFKVELVRIYTMSGGSGEAFSFEENDIVNAIRCLKWAAVWLWRARKRRADSRTRWF
ncbi:MAG: hypothetical protein KGM43_01145 [Planctomycetota bacterium]|nr:hypothetical protein [Planctomycetota bacterium]